MNRTENNWIEQNKKGMNRTEQTSNKQKIRILTHSEKIPSYLGARPETLDRDSHLTQRIWFHANKKYKRINKNKEKPNKKKMKKRKIREIFQFSNIGLINGKFILKFSLKSIIDFYYLNLYGSTTYSIKKSVLQWNVPVKDCLLVVNHTDKFQNFKRELGLDRFQTKTHGLCHLCYSLRNRGRWRWTWNCGWNHRITGEGSENIRRVSRETERQRDRRREREKDRQKDIER